MTAGNVKVNSVTVGVTIGITVGVTVGVTIGITLGGRYLSTDLEVGRCNGRR